MILKLTSSFGLFNDIGLLNVEEINLLNPIFLETDKFY